MNDRIYDEEPSPPPRGERKIVRRDGRLVVESLPGEEPITDEEVRAALNEMDW